MVLFNGPLVIESTGTVSKQSGLPQYRVLAPFSFDVGPGFYVNVPVGFTTDLASLPWPSRNWFKPSDKRWAQAAVVHDYCCSKRLFSRSLCDHLFIEAMLTNGTPWHIAWTMYAACKVRSVYLKIREGRSYYISDGR